MSESLPTGVAKADQSELDGVFAFTVRARAVYRTPSFLGPEVSVEAAILSGVLRLELLWGPLLVGPDTILEERGARAFDLGGPHLGARLTLGWSHFYSSPPSRD